MQMTHLIFKKVGSVDRNSILIKGGRKAFDSSRVLSSVTVGFGSGSSVCLLWVSPCHLSSHGADAALLTFFTLTLAVLCWGAWRLLGAAAFGRGG